MRALQPHFRSVSKVFKGILGACLAVALSPLLADSPEATISQPSGNPTVWIGDAITFAGTTSTAGSFSWTFGDGATGAGATTNHAFNTAGTFTVTMKVAYQTQTCTKINLDGNCISWKTSTFYATATRTVTVVPRPAITLFSASSNNVRVGTGATLTWNVSNATSVSISGIGSVATSGSQVVYPSAATTTYTLTASNAAGTIPSASVTIASYTVTVSISPASVLIPFKGTQPFSGVVNPADQGVTWSATGGSMNGSTYTGTEPGVFLVRVQSVEDATKYAQASVTVQSVSVPSPTMNLAADKLFVGTPIGFSVSVSGASDPSVIWSVSNGQTIDAHTGWMTPTAAGTFTVTATSLCDGSKSGSVSIIVQKLKVNVNPAQVTVKSGQSQVFSASVSGPDQPSQTVTWFVDGIQGGNASVGTITPIGQYTAPSTSGNHTILAVSKQDPSSSGSGGVRVPGWQLKWVKDIAYVGTKEMMEVGPNGMQITLVDHLGSPRFAWDGITPATAAPDDFHLIEQKFMPFGESLNSATANSKIAKGFTNHEQTDASGLIYMQARFYAPWFGRFLSPDPARDQHFEETQSWNIYSYVQNSPTMSIDPTGMFDDPIYQVLKGAVKGVWKEAKAMASGAYHLVKGEVMGQHPMARAAVGAGAKLVDVVDHPAANAKAAAGAAKQAIQEADTVEKKAELATRVGVNVLLVAGTGGSGEAAGAAKLGQLGDAAKVAEGFAAAEDFAKLSGMLREAAQGVKDFGIGSATVEQANALGRAWVGEGATLASDGKTLVSANGLRQYRPPSLKPNSPLAVTGTQANLEGRAVNSGKWTSNAHIDIVH